MIRKISTVILMSLCCMAVPALAQNHADVGIANAPESSNALSSAAERVAAFALANGVSAWPRTDGCEYDRSFAGVTVGLILTINLTTAGIARWDGRCHVPMRHELTGVPPGLAPGRYVVAATSSESDQERLFTNRQLKILAILGTVPQSPELLDAAMAQICTPVAASEETDHDCRDRNRKR